MTSDEDICNLLKDAVKEEVKAAEEYRALRFKIMSIPIPLKREIPYDEPSLGDIANDQEGHAEILAEIKERLCPGDDPDLSGLSEAAKRKLSQIWEAAKKRTKYEAELTSKCRIDAMRESKRIYDESMRKCAVEKRIAPPP